MAMPRPHAVAMSASPMPPVTAETDSSALPMLRQAQQWRERDQRVHHREETSGALEFEAGRQLQRPQQGTVPVADMIQAVMDHADDRVFRAFGNFAGSGEVGIFQRGQHLLHFLRIPFAAFAQPPEGAFAHDGDGHKGADEDGQHDGAAFAEEFKYDVCEHGIHGMI